MIEQFFKDVEGPDRDWQDQEYEIYEDRQELIVENWTENTPFWVKEPWLSINKISCLTHRSISLNLL